MIKNYKITYFGPVVDYNFGPLDLALGPIFHKCFEIVGIWIPDWSGIQLKNTSPVVERSFEYHVTAKISLFWSGILIPTEYHLITHHLNTGLVFRSVLHLINKLVLLLGCPVFRSQFTFLNISWIYFVKGWDLAWNNW